MKHFTLLFTFFFLTFAVVAQNSNMMQSRKYQKASMVITPQVSQIATPIAPAVAVASLAEGFEGADFPPTGWTTIDADGDTQDWFAYEYDGTAHTGTKSAASASYSGAALTPENYLITPQLTVTAGMMLSYWVAAQDPDWTAEKYKVVVSTTGADAADFTEILVTETLTPADSEWGNRTLDLAAYVGQDIHVAFVHFDCTDNFYIKFDDVSTTTVGINNANMEDVSVSVYPNPASDILNIRSANRVIAVNVFNIVGQTVISTNPGANQTELDLSTLTSGVYFVKVETILGTKTQKVNVSK